MSVAPIPVLEEVQPLARVGGDVLPVLPSLAGLLPGGGLRPGSLVSVSGSTSLVLALMAEASAGGAWCGAVGFPALGALAAAELGIALDRFAVVASPGPQWPVVVAALLDGLDIVAVAPPGPARAGDLRRLAARARERRCVLLTTGEAALAGADVRLTVTGSRWDGLGQGFGHLRAHRVEVRADGRGAAARPRRAAMQLSGVAEAS